MLERIEKTGNAIYSKSTCALMKQASRLRDFLMIFSPKKNYNGDFDPKITQEDKTRRAWRNCILCDLGVQRQTPAAVSAFTDTEGLFLSAHQLLHVAFLCPWLIKVCDTYY